MHWAAKRGFSVSSPYICRLVVRSLHHDNSARVSIAGLSRGSRDVQLRLDATVIPGLGPEFQGTVDVDGTVRRVGNRFYVDLVVSSPATLECDRSLESFSEAIERHLSFVYEVDSDLAHEQQGMDLNDVDVRGILPDAQWLDLTEDIRQELTLGLPMKRVAPQYRNQQLEEIFPTLSDAKEEPADDRWEALKRLREK